MNLREMRVYFKDRSWSLAVSPCAEEQNSAHLVTSVYEIFWMVLNVREVNR